MLMGTHQPLWNLSASPVVDRTSGYAQAKPRTACRKCTCERSSGRIPFPNS